MRHRGYVLQGACKATVSALAVAVFFVCSGAVAAGNGTGCSAMTEASSGFRAYLPDCRSYELVSSPFKEGFPIEAVVARSADGARMIGGGLGAFAGTEIDQTEGDEEGAFFGAAYEFIRGTTGWSTVPLALPASMFPESILMSADASLDRTLWRLRSSTQPAGTYDLYVRTDLAAGGSCSGGEVMVPGACLTKIGHSQAPGRSPHIEEFSRYFAGASADLAKVLVAKEPIQGLWGGDSTVSGKSLYEYAGVDVAEPSLVGVRNERSVEEEAALEHKTSINEAADLISRCGVWLGSLESGDTYNAVSETGDIVLFTADECFEGPGEPPVNELYARVGRSKTIDISEPSAENCSACNTSSPTEGVFQGASSDGARVFFLSEQAGLLPGALGENLYLYDVDGAAHEKLVRVSDEVAKPEVRGVVRVSQDGSHVYFVAGGVLASNRNVAGEEALAGADNLYAYEPDPANPGHYKTSFVAMLCSGSGESGAVSDPGCHGSDESLWSREDSRPIQATPDGRFLLFSSFANLTPDDSSGIQQLFEFDATTGTIVRISRGQLVADGAECATTKKIEERYNCDGNTNSAQLTPFFSGEGFVGVDSPVKAETGSDVSNDGSEVFFEGADSLVPGATLGLRNVYEYHDGNVHLISDGQDATFVGGGTAVRLLGADASGADVFFTTSDRLVGQDTDTQQDIYDARVEGGFPGPASTPVCSAESCRAVTTTPPGLPNAGSVTVGGGGNLPPPIESKPKPKVKPPSRAQRLASALRACMKKPQNRRAACRIQARKRYGKTAKQTSRNTMHGAGRGH
jgi:hypothetical protein